MKKDSRIYVAGHNGMVGSAIIRKLINEGYINLITASSEELDLRNPVDVSNFFTEHKPEYVFLCAAKVGGIIANKTQPGTFMYDNIMISTNVIHNSYVHDVKKLINLGSSCIYPNNITRSIREEDLLNGPLETTNESYAVAKISSLKMCQAYNKQYNTDFITIMPCNLYGTNDNYNPMTSHVLPALVKKFVDAQRNDEKYVKIWGSGEVYREFLHVDDLASACLMIMEKYSSLELADYVNVGSGEDIKISSLVSLIKTLLDYFGNSTWDNSKPDGTYKKLLDSSIINSFGWKPEIDLKTGLLRTIEEYKSM